jgi:glycosyltransferase involved in cell wall biosynthesis/tetratricopeptide (TPR) repeat protein
MIYLSWFLIGFLVLRLMVVLANLAARPWLRDAGTQPWLRKEGIQAEARETNSQPQFRVADMPTQSMQPPESRPGEVAVPASNAIPLVSVLIPARNEGPGIGKLLDSLVRHDYPRLEILVYDDLSTDNTAGTVQEYGRRDHRISLIKGGPLPAGWLGKNHGCHRLAEQAKGDYLLFLDADVEVENGLIINALAHLQKHRLALLSIFPRQRMETPGELAVVPLMNWILVSMLPLPLTRLSSRPSLSAANGQFMLFDADIYRKHLFHEQVRDKRVEDILIFRQIKRIGLRGETLLSNGQVSCRMYSGFREAIQGFSKNVFEFFGGSVLLTLAFMGITVLGFIPVWLSMGPIPAALYLLTGILIRLLSSLLSKQALAANLIFAPVQQFSLVLVVFTGLWNRIHRKTTWKGRNVDMANRIILFLFFVGWFSSQAVAQADREMRERYQNQIYEAYVLNRMPQWTNTLRSMEAAYVRRPEPALLYDILLAQYGLIGYYLGSDDKQQGEYHLERAEKNLEELKKHPAYKSGSLAFEGAFLAFRITLRPIRSVQLGPRSYRRIDEALEADRTNPRVWIEKGNAAFFTPPIFGGSKTDAIEHYSMAIRLLEAGMPNNYRWLYLSTLVSLANSYEKTGDLNSAIRVLEKALDFEPRFSWVKDEMLPDFRSRQ